MLYVAIGLGLALLQFAETVWDAHCDKHFPRSFGYRYSDIPPDINIIEMWVILALGVGLGVSLKIVVAVMVIQVLIAVFSLVRQLMSRRPFWFNWV